MRLILLGPPGAGKGTQAAYICRNLSIPQISTGDMLRHAIREGSALGREAKKVMDRGDLVSDDIIVNLVTNRLHEPDCVRGYLLDGFPRTIAQAEALQHANIRLDCVLEIHVPDENILERISGRLFHPASGRTYHVRLNPPKTAGQDDATGEPLIQRDDDREETVRNRLRTYHDQTRPLVAHYAKWSAENADQALTYRKVLGVGSVEEVSQRIHAALSPLGVSNL